MAIETLSHIDLIGNVVRYDTVVSELQGLGILHHIPQEDMEESQSSLIRGIEKRLEQAKEAHYYLSGVKHKRRALTSAEQFDMETVIGQVLNNKLQLQSLKQQRDDLLQQIKKYEPWGYFDLDDLSGFYDYRFWFYKLPIGAKRELPLLDLCYKVVKQNHQWLYVVVVAQHQPQESLLPATPDIETSISLSDLEQKLDHLEHSIEEAYVERQALSRWLYLIQEKMNAFEDHLNREKVSASSYVDDSLFHIEGWVANKNLPELKAFCDEQGVSLTIRAVADDEAPPTLLSAPKHMDGATELVTFYRTPSYHAWDPSLLVFSSFALFFAMILADAGYALIFMGILLLYWRRMGRNETARKGRSLAMGIALVSLCYGVLVGSYFGVDATNHWLGMMKLIDLNDFDAMIKLSVTIGVLHLFIANFCIALHAYRVTHRIQNTLPSLGWCLLLSGGWLSWQWSNAMSFSLPAVGLLMILLFSGSQRVSDMKSFLRNLAEGVMAVTGASKAFGDVMSYMRLFALGLASASLAVTFNQMASQVAQSYPGLGILLSGLIVLIGHGLNIVLALVSGVIHGLRLNYIEFFNWALSEEGYPFNAFRRKEQSL